jgi:CRISPR/Cas system-associated endoribonuclease Cas2
VQKSVFEILVNPRELRKSRTRQKRTLDPQKYNLAITIWKEIGKGGWNT